MPTKPEPLALQAVIPDKASAIAFSGGAGDAARLVIDVYSDDQANLLKLLNLRGKTLIIVLQEGDSL